MKISKLVVFLGALLLSGAARAQAFEKFVQEVQLLTRPAPGAADAIDSIAPSLQDAEGFRISVCAQAGATLTGGALQAWVFNSRTQLWERNTDLDLTVGNVAQQCRVFPDSRVAERWGNRVLYAASAVTVSAGTQVTVNYLIYVNFRK